MAYASQYRRRGDRGGAGEVGAYSRPLASFEWAIGAADDPGSGWESRAPGVEAHGAACFVPLKAGILEHAIDALLLCRFLDDGRARNTQRPDSCCDPPATPQRRRVPQVSQAAVGA